MQCPWCCLWAVVRVGCNRGEIRVTRFNDLGWSASYLTYLPSEENAIQAQQCRAWIPSESQMNFLRNMSFEFGEWTFHGFRELPPSCYLNEICSRTRDRIELDQTDLRWIFKWAISWYRFNALVNVLFIPQLMERTFCLLFSPNVPNPINVCSAVNFNLSTLRHWHLSFSWLSLVKYAIRSLNSQ